MINGVDKALTKQCLECIGYIQYIWAASEEEPNIVSWIPHLNN